MAYYSHESWSDTTFSQLYEFSQDRASLFITIGDTSQDPTDHYQFDGIPADHTIIQIVENVNPGPHVRQYVMFGTQGPRFSIPTERPATPIEHMGLIIGEIRPNAVWFYGPIVSTDRAAGGSPEIRELLFAALEQALTPEAETEALAAALREWGERSFEATLSGCRESVQGQEIALVQARDRVQQAVAELRRSQDMLDAVLLTAGNGGAQRVVSEWELLKDHPRVAGGTLRGNTLVITTTGDIRMTRPDTGESRWLGAFKVSIDLANGFTVSLRNLNTRRGGRDHPHVVNSRPCFGGHHEGFYELLQQGELYTAFDLLIQYIETLNLNDEYGRYGSYWFDQPDPRPLEVAEAVA